MPDNNDKRPDELDLTELLRNFISFLRSSGKIILGFALLGVLVGTLLYITSPNQYSSKLVLHSFILTNQEHIQIIGSMSELLKNKEYTELGRRMNCEPEMLTKLTKISAEDITKANPDGNLNGFLIMVLVTDTAILDKLQKGIINGLENSDYIKEKIAVRKSSLSILINRVSDEIRKLDSVKATVETALKNNISERTSSSFIINAGEINNEIISLNEKLLTYQEDLKFAGAVQVLQKFNKLSKPVLPKKRTLISLGLLAGTAIGYFVYLWLYIKRKILNPPSEKKITKPIIA
jgi:hypothetical protein